MAHWVDELGWLTEREWRWFNSEDDEASLSDFNNRYSEPYTEDRNDTLYWSRRFDRDAPFTYLGASAVRQGWMPQGCERRLYPMLDEPDSPTARYVPLEMDCADLPLIAFADVLELRAKKEYEALAAYMRWSHAA